MYYTIFSGFEGTENWLFFNLYFDITCVNSEEHGEIMWLMRPFMKLDTKEMYLVFGRT